MAWCTSLVQERRQSPCRYICISMTLGSSEVGVLQAQVVQLIAWMAKGWLYHCWDYALQDNNYLLCEWREIAGNAQAPAQIWRHGLSPASLPIELQDTVCQSLGSCLAVTCVDWRRPQCRASQHKPPRFSNHIRSVLQKSRQIVCVHVIARRCHEAAFCAQWVIHI